MAPLKCCVGGCNATSDTHRLFYVPKDDNLRNLWMYFLVPTSPLLIRLTKEQLLRKRVCEQHFDIYQLGGRGQRNLFSYPCLFSAAEIAHGIPLSSEEYHVLAEHNYHQQQGETEIDDITEAGTSLITTQLVKNLKEIVEEVAKTGLIPLGLVCDQGSTFRSAMKILREETIRARDVQGIRDYGTIEISGQDLSIIYDPPHLLKSIRNNFVTKDIIFDGKVGSWEDILFIYGIDSQTGHTRALPKLNAYNMVLNKIKKMKVSAATHVLSERTAAMLNYTNALCKMGRAKSSDNTHSSRPRLSRKPSDNNQNYRPRPSRKTVLKLQDGENLNSEEPPPADTVCRVCLVRNQKLYTVTNDLQNVYETITIEEYNKVGFPVCMCHTCLTELRKCHRFVETARDSDRVLEQWYRQQHEIKKAEPQDTFTKEESTSTENDEDPFDQVKAEEVELEKMDEEPECDLDMDIQNEDIDEQTDNEHKPNDTIQDDKYRQQETKKLLEDQAPGTSSKLDGEKTETRLTLDSDKANIDSITEMFDVIKNCSECDFKCMTKNDLSRHMRFHDSSRPHVCDVCQYRFEHSYNLKKHKFMHKAKAKSKAKVVKITEYQCERCDYKTLMQRDFITHMILHTGVKLLSCDICGFRTASRASLVGHIKAHTAGKPLSCDTCSYRASSRTALARHLKRHTGEKPFKCIICDYKARTRNNLTIHMEKHNDEAQIPMSCEFCNYECEYKCLLKLHMKTHTGEKKFLCELCGYSCTIRHRMTEHMRSHTGDKPFACNKCNYKSASKSLLVVHLRTHDVKKLLSCNICEFKCANRSSLTLHHLRHTGERPFPCNICDYKAITKTLLNRHKKIHTGERPVMCDICSNSFRCIKSLRRHIGAVHNREKPFSCQFCKYKTFRNENLTVHMRTHTGEKPFACDICKCKFSHNVSLKQHLVKIHNKKIE